MYMYILLKGCPQAPPRFSSTSHAAKQEACNTEKLGRVWGKTHMYM